MRTVFLSGLMTGMLCFLEMSAHAPTSRKVLLGLAVAVGCLFAVGCLLGCVDTALAASGSAVYVVGGRTLSIINTDGLAVAARVPVGTRPRSSSRSIAPHPNGRVVYVAQGTTGVAVLDTASQTVVATVPMPGLTPADFILSPDGRVLFVAGGLLGVRGTFVTAIDTETNAESGRLPSPLYGGGGGSLVATNASGTKLYLIGASASFLLPSVEIVDATTTPLTSVTSISFGFGDTVTALVVHPAGTFAYAATRHAVTVIDGATDAVSRTVALDDSGISTSLAMDPTGAFVYALQVIASGDAAGRLSAIDTQTNAVVATVSLPLKPRAAAVDVARGKIYVAGDVDDCPPATACPARAAITIVDGLTRTVVETLPTGLSSTGVASAVAIDPPGNAVYVLDPAGLLTVIDPATHAVSASLLGGAAMALGPRLPAVAGGLRFYVDRSSDAAAAQFGAPGDDPVPADYDGDGRVDLAVFRPREAGGEGVWWIARSSDGGVYHQQWGAASLGDVPVPADYDGDGRADVAVWRPSTDASGQGGLWYVLRSSDGLVVGQQWGAPDDVPVPGDYDGDGRADLAVWRATTGDFFAQDSSTWFLINSSDGTAVSVPLGALGDVPVAADYDGDGRTDLAVWRPTNGQWLILGSRTGLVSSVGFGAPGDVPVPRDYDGDGKADLAVWRSPTGEWFILSSRSGAVLGRGWGATGDLPVPGDYDGDEHADLTVYRP